jgi:hypothetical protein
MIRRIAPPIESVGSSCCRRNRRGSLNEHGAAGSIRWELYSTRKIGRYTSERLSGWQTKTPTVAFASAAVHYDAQLSAFQVR